IVVSDADRVALHHIAPGANYAVIPNGVDLEFFRPGPGREEGEERGGAVFVGETTWFPNRDALQYFCDEILPRMRVGGGEGAQAVRAVLQDERLRRRLGAEGRRTVERHYSWERIGESMLRLYRSLYESPDVGSGTPVLAAR